MSRNGIPSLSSLGHCNLVHRLLVGFILMMILFSAGCITVGDSFPITRVPDLKVGKTTQEQVRQMFGDPWRVGVEDGQRTWTYGKYRYQLFVPTVTEDLVIRFDDRKIVSSYTFNTTEHPE